MRLAKQTPMHISHPPYHSIGGGTLSQGPKIRTRRHRRTFSSLAPQTKFQPSKLRYETLEISEVFVNPYSVLLFIDRATPALLPRIISPDHVWYVCEVINVFEA